MFTTTNEIRIKYIFKKNYAGEFEKLNFGIKNFLEYHRKIIFYNFAFFSREIFHFQILVNFAI
jgi:hypothetical protein